MWLTTTAAPWYWYSPLPEHEVDTFCAAAQHNATGPKATPQSPWQSAGCKCLVSSIFFWLRICATPNSFAQKDSPLMLEIRGIPSTSEHCGSEEWFGATPQRSYSEGYRIRLKVSNPSLLLEQISICSNNLALHKPANILRFYGTWHLAPVKAIRSPCSNQRYYSTHKTQA